MDEKPPISTTRTALWVPGGAIGRYLVISGVVGAINAG